MKKIFILLCISLTLILSSCSKDTDTPENPIEEPTEEPIATKLYFPPIDSNEWETLSVEELKWNSDAVQPLYNFLEERGTDAFLIVKDGRLVLEKYFGTFTQTSNHAWNSTGKTLTAMTTGIAQQEGFLKLEDISADYMGAGWSSLTTEQEQNITVWHHLTMTTGLDYTVNDIFCTDVECLQYKNEPGTFWFYHNAPYTLLDSIITGAVGQDFGDYFTLKIKNKIGMQGSWFKFGFNNVYFSNARSMARFGILNLNKGVWDEETILADSSYFDAMITTSQDMNPSYGYLYWLNGKSSYRVPGSELEFTGKLIPNAPDDLYCGLGKNDQKLYVVPSKGLVIVRMGDDGGETLLGPSSFDNELWGLINAIIN